VNLNQTVSVGTLQIAHSVALTGLAGNTKYYYQSRSKDAAGNEGVSPTRSFKTLQRLPKLPKVSNLRAPAGSVEVLWHRADYELTKQYRIIRKTDAFPTSPTGDAYTSRRP